MVKAESQQWINLNDVAVVVVVVVVDDDDVAVVADNDREVHFNSQVKVMSVVAIVNSASTTVALYVALVVVFTADVIAVALLLWGYSNGYCFSICYF
jgi:hypothetical protein